MATYTIELRKICEIYGRDEVENWFKNYNLEDYLTPLQIETINKNGTWSKEKLAKKIVNHYYMREIGFETPYLFKHYAEVYMEEIMESKLPLIYSNSLEYDPLINVDFTETFNRNIQGTAENTGSSNSNSSQNSSGINVSSDTPENQIDKNEVLKGAYASNVNASENDTSIKDNTSTSSNGSSNSQEEYTRHQKGNSGVSTTSQSLIKQYRDIIVSIDKDIIKELSKLFMGLY